MVVSAHKAISSRSSCKLKPILPLQWQHSWILSLNHALCYLFFFKLCYCLRRAYFGEATYLWVSNLLTLWLKQGKRVNEREMRDFWVSFAPFQVFLSVCFSHSLSSTVDASFFLTFLFKSVCTMIHLSLPKPQTFPNKETVVLMSVISW